jgi:plasmid stabilization system protein ParE
MKRRLVVRPEARNDAREAALWYDRQEPGLGDRFIHELGHLLSRISEHPSHFPEIDQDVRRSLLHRFPYAVYFTVGEEVVTVISILHQRRRPDLWKRKR